MAESPVLICVNHPLDVAREQSHVRAVLRLPVDDPEWGRCRYCKQPNGALHKQGCAREPCPLNCTYWCDFTDGAWDCSCGWHTPDQLRELRGDIDRILATLADAFEPPHCD